MNDDQLEENGQCKSLDEYLSFVRHELRGQLFVIREGTSQVLDGLGGNDCKKCAEILKPSFEYADKIKHQIDDLLQPERFQSVKEKPPGDAGAAASTDPETLKNNLIILISHEVRTPLTIIKEGLSLIIDEIPGELNSGQKELLQDVISNTDRLIQSLEKILRSSPTEIIESCETEI